MKTHWPLESFCVYAELVILDVGDPTESTELMYVQRNTQQNIMLKFATTMTYILWFTNAKKLIFKSYSYMLLCRASQYS